MTPIAPLLIIAGAGLFAARPSLLAAGLMVVGLIAMRPA